MQNNVFIVGNGFDLALGLPTRYSEFAKSKFWPVSENAERQRRYLEQKKYTSLEAYLDDRRNLDTWFDLEQKLYKYAKKNSLVGESQVMRTQMISGETSIITNCYKNEYASILRASRISLENSITMWQGMY